MILETGAIVMGDDLLEKTPFVEFIFEHHVMLKQTELTVPYEDSQCTIRER